MADSFTTSAAQLIQFFTRLFEDQEGYLALKFGKAAPGCPRAFNQTHWYSYPTEVEQAALEGINLSRQGYDVGYIVSLFDRPEAKAAYALPARFIYVDDLPLQHSPIEPSIVIQTSDQKPPQAYIRLDRVIDARTREALSRAWAYHAGADRSGWDRTQVLRLPMTFNYKHAQPQHIYMTGEGHQYSLDNVCHVLQSISVKVQKSEPDPVALGRKAAAGWRQIAVRSLLGPDDKPTRLRKSAWSYRLWKCPIGYATRLGGHERRSGAFYQLVRGLLYCYSPAEAAALAIYHGAWGHEHGKPYNWLETDVMRIIGKLLLTQKHRRRCDRQPSRRPIPAAQGRGRPEQRTTRCQQRVSMGAAHLYDWLREHSDCNTSLATNTELSAALKRTDRTIRRYLDELEAAGLIARYQKACGRIIKLSDPGADTNSSALLNLSLE